MPQAAMLAKGADSAVLVQHSGEPMTEEDRTALAQAGIAVYEVRKACVLIERSMRKRSNTSM